ncbi:hypothetical protein [Tellurirhabdus bombi]|uniref:hypothetical protein n=1 Tax=Tellurirhabdus bombi TaxID=2907205 RepID=UPI001F1E90B2|nr:hypothetical protein [Tellurirhabdus bombi]
MNKYTDQILVAMVIQTILFVAGLVWSRTIGKDTKAAEKQEEAFRARVDSLEQKQRNMEGEIAELKFRQSTTEELFKKDIHQIRDRMQTGFLGLNEKFDDLKEWMREMLHKNQ